MARFSPKTVSFNDGKFELLMISMPDSLARLTEILGKLSRADLDDPDFMLISGSHITIETDRPVAWTLDGEDAGLHKTVDISVMKNALNIIK